MRRIRWNRLAALCMVLVLALSLASPALAADTASGADLRLTATEGTVTLKSSVKEAQRRSLECLAESIADELRH